MSFCKCELHIYTELPLTPVAIGLTMAGHNGGYKRCVGGEGGGGMSLFPLKSNFMYIQVHVHDFLTYGYYKICVTSKG